MVAQREQQKEQEQLKRFRAALYEIRYLASMGKDRDRLAQMIYNYADNVLFTMLQDKYIKF